jgi:ATP-dependent DNA helicase UvrD/PcrA
MSYNLEKYFRNDIKNITIKNNIIKQPIEKKEIIDQPKIKKEKIDKENKDIDNKKHFLLEGLNNIQQKVVIHKDGPVLVSAGPGSGKTRTIIHKIAYYIKKHNINPSSILVITFTKKASTEIDNRLSSLFDDETPNISSGTFHSVCCKILKKNGILKDQTIIDDNQQKNIIREIVKNNKKVHEAIKNISVAKNNIQSPNDVIDKEIKSYYEKYEEYMKKSNYVDFDDLLYITVKNIKENESFRDTISKYYKYIIVDEFQDTNSLQFEILICLAKGFNNITIVGDVDQSIYGWRFADYMNIEKFKNIYPNHTMYLLEQNYRSTSRIIKYSNKIIENEKNRLNSKIWTENEKGEHVNTLSYGNVHLEVYNITKKILKLQENYKLSEIAVLIRINCQSRLFEESFLKNQIPYNVIGECNFYKREEIQDMIAYLKFVDSKDVESFKRIANIQKLNIRKNILEKMTDELRDNGWEKLISVKENKTKLNFLIEIINECQNMLDKEEKISELVSYIIKKIDYRSHLMKKYNSDKINNVLENLNEFIVLSLRYSNINDLLKNIKDLEKQSKENNNEESKEKVSIITLHSAKGLEWDVVFIPSVNDGILPYYKCIEEDRVDEERRLLYVGTTRARKFLEVSFCRKIQKWNKVEDGEMTRFLLHIKGQ